MKFGFELEAFCIKEGKPVLVPVGLPLDECGWLAEIRSEPHNDLLKAAYLLNAERAIVEAQTQKLDIQLLYKPLYEIPRDLKVEATRRSGKGQIKFRNIYGYQTHKNPTNLQTASLHVSFTNEQEGSYQVGKEWKKYAYPGFVDHAKIIVGMDKAFKDELRAAKRNPGFYERKYDGRIEYRSLPNDVSLTKVVGVLTKLLKECAE